MIQFSTTDEQFEEFTLEGGQVVVSDTLTVLNNYVEGISMEVDKTRLREILKELYVEATVVGA